MGGLSLPGLLQAEQRAGLRNSKKAVIMIYRAGAPPHQDMYDLKMDAPSGAKAPGAGRDNSFKPAARNERMGGGGRGAAAQPAQGQSAMAAAFAKLQTKR